MKSGVSNGVRSVRRIAPFFLLIVAAIIGVTGCETLGKPESAGAGMQKYGEASVSGVLVTLPIDDNPAFFGTAPRLRNQDEEEDLARRNAAVQASRYIRLSGRAVFYSERAGASADYIRSISIDDDYELADELASTLVEERAVRDSGGSYILFRLPGYEAPGIGYNPRDVSGNPRWLRNPPEIEGYYVGIGSAERSRILADSVESADRAALAEILAQLRLDIRSRRSEVTVEGLGTASAESNLEVARGRIEGFYVLDRWISESGDSISALAICPKNQNL